MNTVFVYDDSWPVPQEVVALTGIERFGRLIHERARLQDLALAAARDALDAAVRLAEPADRDALLRRLDDAPADRRYVYMTSDLVEAEPGALRLFLGKLAYATQDLVGRPEGAGPHGLIGAVGPDLLRDLLRHASPDARRGFLAEQRGRFTELPTPVLASIHEVGAFVRFVSGTFYTRAFNRIRTEPRTIVKESADREKMRREHDWWYQLPPELQRFAAQPYGFELTPAGARYRMERYVVPDASILWIHDALTPDEFDTFLDGVLGWVRAAPRRAEDRSDALYVDKVERRAAELAAAPEGARLDALLAHATPHRGVRALVDRYLALLRADPGPAEVAIQHGDLCFSNILYDKRTELLKFVDPRGASRPDELWGDATYDLAKLSHSALGGYDFLNHGLFDVVVDEDLGLKVLLHEPEGRHAHKERFRAALRALGHEPARIRLREASLFLSMLPLHRESPRKLLAFALTAAAILDEVEVGRRSGRLFG